MQEVNAFGGIPTNEGNAMIQEVYPTSPYGTLAQHIPAKPPLPPLHDQDTGTMMAQDQVSQPMPAAPSWNSVVPINIMSVPHEMSVDRPGMVASRNTSELVHELQAGPLPSQREWAVEALTQADWRHDPSVVAALLKGATRDPAATVRAACVRGLVKMDTSDRQVLTVLESLKGDPDPRVRTEIETAMASGAIPAASPAATQPVGFILPSK